MGVKWTFNQPPSPAVEWSGEELQGKQSYLGRGGLQGKQGQGMFPGEVIRVDLMAQRGKLSESNSSPGYSPSYSAS